MRTGGWARRLCLGAALALVACGRDGDDAGWNVLVEGDGGEISVSPARVVPLGGGTYRLWLRDRIGSPEVDADGRSYDAFVSQVEFDCGRRRARELVGEIPQTMLDETDTHAPFAVDEPWRPVADEPRMAQALAAFCDFARAKRL
ncbi:MAG TPA: hypothetical protein VLK84_06370 [Longimicrobium sp.]|nr:hypothetical protein [Longimicrobium sp.]